MKLWMVSAIHNCDYRHRCLPYFDMNLRFYCRQNSFVDITIIVSAEYFIAKKSYRPRYYRIK